MSAESVIDALIRTRRVIVCAGPGGVGKTTTSAAIALRAACLGKRTLVLTVDPARRLANSLGLEGFQHDEQRIGEHLFHRAKIPTTGAVPELYAMMLDTKRVFDSVVGRYAPNPEVRDRILKNPFYQQASVHLAGSQEYMAMEKVYELTQAGRYDLLVLDTPPTVHALDFLDAPSRLEEFLGQSVSGLMARSSRVVGRLGLGFLKANKMILRGIGKFVGTDFFVDLLDFLQDFSEMYTGFKTRAHAVKELMRSPEVGFVVLTGPERSSIDEGLFLRDRLVAEDMPFATFVINRLHVFAGEVPDGAAIRAALTAHGASPPTADAATERLTAGVTAYARLALRDAALVSDLRPRLAGAPLLTVPEFDQDIHDLAGLYAYGQQLLVQ